MKLDLGCGTQPELGHVGVDLPADELPRSEHTRQPYIDASGICRFDLCSGTPWPFEDDSIDGLCSSHVIEHLPAARIATYAWSKSSLGLDVLAFAGMQDALFWFLDESWRVSKPGAEFRLSWPALRNDQTGEFCWAAFQDPTHYRFIPVEQVPYWSRAGRALYEVSQYRARCNWVSKPNYFQRLLGANVVENCFTFVKEP